MKRHVAWGFLFGAVLACRADTPAGPCTLQDCIRIGLDHSGVAEIARRNQAIARTLVHQARADALPSISLIGTYTRLDELESVDLGDGPVKLGTLDNYNVRAEVRQALYSGGRVVGALHAARLNEHYADVTRQRTEAGLVRDICTGFYDILLAKEAVGVRAATVEQLERFRDQVARKHDKGAVSEFELLSARVRLANERPLLIKARNDRDLAVAAFRRLLSVDDEAFRIEGELAPVPEGRSLEELSALALQRRPALRVLQTVVQLREVDRDVTRADGRPDLSVSFNYNGQNSYGFVSFDDDWQWHWNAGLTLSWNVWDGGLTRGKVEEKELELQKSRIQLAETERDVKLEVRQAYLDMKHAEESLAASRGTVELAAKALDIARVRHEAGVATRLEFTDATVELGRARLAVAVARHNQMAAVARLHYACGLNLGPREEND